MGKYSSYSQKQLKELAERTEVEIKERDGKLGSLAHKINNFKEEYAMTRRKQAGAHSRLEHVLIALGTRRMKRCPAFKDSDYECQCLATLIKYSWRSTFLAHQCGKCNLSPDEARIEMISKVLKKEK